MFLRGDMKDGARWAAAWRKEGTCRAHKAPPRPSPAAPGPGPVTRSDTQCRGQTEAWLGAQTGRQSARLWGTPCVPLSSREAGMGIWVPDAVLDTHSTLHSLRHGCHMVTATREPEHTESETVTSRPAVSPRGEGPGPQALLQKQDSGWLASGCLAPGCPEAPALLGQTRVPASARAETWPPDRSWALWATAAAGGCRQGHPCLGSRLRGPGRPARVPSRRDEGGTRRVAVPAAGRPARLRQGREPGSQVPTGRVGLKPARLRRTGRV